MKVCQTCGSRGYHEALVVCNKCQTVANHIYCLDKSEETDDGRLIWTCEFCEPRVSELSNSTGNMSYTERIEMFKKPQDTAAEPLPTAVAPRLRDGDAGPTNNEIQSPYGDLEKNRDPTKQMDNTVVSLRLHSDCEAKKANASNSGSAEELSIMEDEFSSTTQPLPNPIWMGSFQIDGEYSCIVAKMVAHLSNEASEKASLAASSLPVLLCLEMVPKLKILPLKFKNKEPTADNIAVYFFPEDHRTERAYDSLVDDIIEHDFAMISKVNDVELLIFSSYELQTDDRRLQRKYYLWGMFRRKKTLPHNQTDDCRSSLHGSNHSWPSNMSSETHAKETERNTKNIDCPITKTG